MPVVSSTGGGTIKSTSSKLKFPEGLAVSNSGYNPKDATHPSTVAIMGGSGTGKTLLAAGISKSCPVLFLDMENGMQSITSPNNQDRINLENIRMQPIFDTVDHPYGHKTIRSLLKGEDTAICGHGMYYGACPTCGDDIDNYIGYNLRKLPKDTVVILDSGTQLDISLRTLVYGGDMDAGIEGDVDTSFHDWKRIGIIWNMFMTEIQTSHLKGYRIIVLFHEDEKNGKFIPSVGTRDYALQAGKFFGSVLRTYVNSKGEYKVQCTAEGGQGTCKNRDGLPEGSIQSGEDILRLFEHVEPTTGEME